MMEIGIAKLSLIDTDKLLNLSLSSKAYSAVQVEYTKLGQSL